MLRPLVATLFASALVALPAARAQARPAPADPLARLASTSSAHLVVERRDDGSARLVRGRGGHALVDGTGASRAETATAFARRYGGALRRTGHAPDLRATGHVGRLQQYVDGLPVVAGEATVALTHDGDPQALAGELADDVALPSVQVTAAAAQATAQAVLSRTTGESATAGAPVLWAYDPALVGEAGTGVRPVWRMRVTSGPQAEDVLVDAVRGSLALRIPLDEGAGTRVCDAGSVAHASSLACTSAAAVRQTGEPVSGNTQVDQAFDGVTAAIDTWALAGRDLTELDGTGPAGSRVLEAWVRWCDASGCPMDNAFWDGTRIHLGDGYAGAVDVVAHELTHGVIEHTANLMYLHESGAINESIADIGGELTDQQDTSEGGDDAWLLGEALPGGALRSMADPTAYPYRQPDAMTSPYYGTGDVARGDAGDVHTNSGVGNKTAWLLAHGGVLNGHTVASIDGDDPHHTASLRLWSRVLDLLTSGSEYADLAGALEATCDDLVAGATPGFSATTCDQVRAATAATALRTPPPGAAGEAPSACGPDEVRKVLLRDDDTHHPSWVRAGTGHLEDGRSASLWGQDPSLWGLASYTRDGTSSWFALDPDPVGWGDSPTARLTTSSSFTVPPVGRTYLHFDHAYVLDYYAGKYYDGGRVSMLTSKDGSWLPSTTALPWVNGPTRTLRTGSGAASGSGPAFSGDSHGIGSSRVEITALKGQAVRPRFELAADQKASMDGWWVDDIELYTCGPSTPTAVRSLAPHSTSSGTALSWSSPAWSGPGIASYKVTRSDGTVRTYPASTRTATYPTLPAGSAFRFTVVAISTDGEAGATASTKVVRTRLGLARSALTVRKGSTETLTASLSRADTGDPLGGRTVTFQRRLVGQTSWTTIGTVTTASTGRAARSTTVNAAADYRARYGGSGHWVGLTTTARRVSLR